MSLPQNVMAPNIGSAPVALKLILGSEIASFIRCANWSGDVIAVTSGCSEAESELPK